MPEHKIAEKHQLSTPEGFSDFMLERANRRAKIMLQKNNDYAASDRFEEDPLRVFRNFMSVEKMGICGAGVGLLVRITDKYMRMVNLLNPNHTQTVSDEAVEDTMLDLQNYIDILAAIMKPRKDIENGIKVNDQPERNGRHDES